MSQRVLALFQRTQVLLDQQLSISSVSGSKISSFVSLRLEFAYISSLYVKSRDSLREAVLLANSEELAVISANALIFTGHIHLLSGQYQESFNVLTSGFDIAEKMSDVVLKSYAITLFRGTFTCACLFE